MTTIEEKAYQDVPSWAVDAVARIYNNRTGDWQGEAEFSGM
jgi:hypothetical protein